MSEISVNVDVDDILYEMDNDDLISHLESQGYSIVEKSSTGNQPVNTLADDQIINAICDRMGQPYTLSKMEVLELFRDDILKM